MAESTGTSLYNAKNFLHPIEGGIVNKFDKLFEEREKKLKDWIARAIINKQEFLTRTFPNLITIGAEHPQLSGGVLYMMGLISPHIHGGSEAVNSIPRRFAERMSTQKDAAASHKLAEIHTKQESILRIHPDAIFPKPETGGNPLINREMKRTEITRQLYAFKKRFVEIQYEKDGKKIDLGANGCLTSTLNPESKTGKTMVFICSSGGEPPGVESFAVEYAMRTGDKVIIVGMPDAHSGTITKEFAQVVKNDAKPPLVDLKRTFKTPTYEAHTQFFKRMIASLVADGQQFDLYSHSGGGMIAKNLLNMPDVASRVTNAVFLNSAGVTDMHTRFPVFFRVKPVIDQAIQALQNWRKMIRMNYEKDNRQDANTPEYQFRSSVTVALQDGSHYRQPGWDTMSVNGGKIVLYVGGKDRLVGGREFASFIAPKIQNTSTSLEYDSNGHHGSPFTEPERVFDRLFSKHFPDRKVLV